jgi:peptidoglycan/LPS O-acetylase OafA/YrhL
VFAAWTLTAFSLGAFLGMLLRRIVPAMAATLGAYLVLALVTWQFLRDHYPVSTFWPMQFFEAGWLLILSVLLIAATVSLVRRYAV